MSGKYQKVAYYPGCALEGTGHAYNRSTKELGKALGLEITELDNWNCCGAMEVKNIDPKLQTYLSARNLSIAEEMGFETVMAPCNGCYHNLKKAEYDLANDADSRAVNNRLSGKAGHKAYESGKVETIHALDWIKEAIGEEGLKARVKNSLKGLKIANYYGCMYTRPRHIFPEKDRGPRSESTCEATFYGRSPRRRRRRERGIPAQDRLLRRRPHALRQRHLDQAGAQPVDDGGSLRGRRHRHRMSDLSHRAGDASGPRGKSVRAKDLGEDSLFHPTPWHGARPVGAQGRRARELLRFFRPVAGAEVRLMTGAPAKPLDAIAARIDAIVAAPDAALVADASGLADELLGLGEGILEAWLAARGTTPTTRTAEGFRLLALHRQGAKGEPSFNACRETCRELVYHRNLVRLDPAHADTARRLRLGAMVAKHLALFFGGKLEAAGLGEFCCSSRPLRQHEANVQPGIA